MTLDTKKMTLILTKTRLDHLQNDIICRMLTVSLLSDLKKEKSPPAKKTLANQDLSMWDVQGNWRATLKQIAGSFNKALIQLVDGGVYVHCYSEEVIALRC